MSLPVVSLPVIISLPVYLFWVYLFTYHEFTCSPVMSLPVYLSRSCGVFIVPCIRLESCIMRSTCQCVEGDTRTYSFSMTYFNMFLYFIFFLIYFTFLNLTVFNSRVIITCEVLLQKNYWMNVSSLIPSAPPSLPLPPALAALTQRHYF